MAHPLIDALPGFPVKISAVLPSLDKAWADEGENASRASQMNLVLMFGAGVAPADAQARFDDASASPSVILAASSSSPRVPPPKPPPRSRPRSTSSASSIPPAAASAAARP